MRVKDCMCNNLVKVTPDATVEEAAKLMNSNQVGCVPVCSKDDTVVGFLTDRDIITRAVANHKDCSQTKISDIMTINVIKTTTDTDIQDAVNTMANNQVRRLPVLEKGKVVGMLTIGDIAQNQDISCEDVGYTFEQICGCGCSDISQEKNRN
jgi:CBS domain-containing protein